MNGLRVQDVLDSTGAQLQRGRADARLAGVGTDTRSLRPGELFLALSGPNFDGNLFAMEALEKGAGGLLLRATGGSPAPTLLGEAPVLLHRDPHRALADLAAWHRERLRIPVVGITGSCGKTTVKDLVRQLLSSCRRVVASPRSFNNAIGVPLTLLGAAPETEVLVAEIGTNQPGEIAALCRIARPTAGVVTNIGAAHLERLGSLEGVAREKADLVAAVPRDGFVVLNADCRFTPLVSSYASAPTRTFSVEGDGELDARELVFHSGGTTFRLHGAGPDSIELTSPLLGTHNVQNLLAALLVCRGLGLAFDDVLPEVSRLVGGRQRMERRELAGITLFDDSWNSNPDSARAAVRVLSGLHGFGRRVLVLGDMLELGEFAAEMHHRIGMEAAQAGVDLIVPVGELGRAAAAGALEAGLAPAAVVHLATTEEALERVPELLREGDVVLVKGSRGMALERLIGRLEGQLGAQGA